MSGYGCYVNSRYGPGTSFTEVQAHPLHIFASGDLTGLQVDPSKDGVVVDEVPHGVADRLETDILAFERIAQEVLTGESEGSAGAHPPDLEVAGILRFSESTRVLFRRRLPPVGGEVPAECFMRAFVVVALLEEVQLPLLLGEVRSRWHGRLSLHVSVHAFVLAVLLRTGRADSLVNNPELQPPDIEIAQPVADSPYKRVINVR